MSRGFSAGPVDDRSAWRARVYYALLLVVYPLSQLVLNGRVLLTGQLWAELGEYYQVTRSLPFLDQIRTNDAGYIPLPQRLIAGLGTALGVPPAAVPYVWNAFALAGAAAMVGVLCLPAARVLIRSDGLRFVLALMVLLVPDFNTKGFNNATYFAVVLCIVVAAIGVTRSDRAIPGWAWVIPVLMISKPIVLLLLPVLALSAVIGRSRRLRSITAVSLLSAAVQTWSVSTSPSVIGTDSDSSFLERLLVAGQHALGFLGRFATSVEAAESSAAVAWKGAVIAVAALALCTITRHPASGLVLSGLYLIAVTAVTDVFTLGRYGFDATMARLLGPIPIAIDRWFVGYEFGTLLVGAGCLAIIADLALHLVHRATPGRLSAAAPRALAALVVVLFLGWTSSTGWIDRARVASASPGVPITNVSQWQQLADRIGSDDPLLCVPLNSNWVVGRNCTTLIGLAIPEPTTVSLVGFRSEPLAEEGGTVPTELPVPEPVTDGELASVAVMVRPLGGPAVVSGTLALTLDDGTVVELPTQADLSADGGLVQFVDRPARTYTDVVSASVRFDRPVGIAIANVPWTAPGAVYVVWMGPPATG